MPRTRLYTLGMGGNGGNETGSAATDVLFGSCDSSDGGVTVVLAGEERG